MNTRKIVINTCYGGFGLSTQALDLYNRRCGSTVDYSGDIERDDPDLVAVVQELGPYSNGEFSELKIVEVPADVQWEINEYDGVEWVAEVHRRWR